MPLSLNQVQTIKSQLQREAEERKDLGPKQPNLEPLNELSDQASDKEDDSSSDCKDVSQHEFIEIAKIKNIGFNDCNQDDLERI